MVSSEHPRTYAVMIEDKETNVFITESPLNNCQIYSVGGVDDIIWRDDCKEILLFTYRAVGKNQMLVDISSKWLEKLERIMGKENFSFQAPYTNTRTGSSMVMCLIKIRDVI